MSTACLGIGTRVIEIAIAEDFIIQIKRYFTQYLKQITIREDTVLFSTSNSNAFFLFSKANCTLVCHCVMMNPNPCHGHMHG